jgi:AraC-like DNA-binding protein
MLARCYNPKTKGFHRYGGRGITVSDRWRECFENFYADMGPRPGPEYTLDRRNNDLGYYTTNCRWVTGDEQARNKSTNVRLEWEGKSYILADLAKELGVCERRLATRLRNGMSLEKAIRKPPVEKYTLAGLTLSIREWAEHLGKSQGTIKNRIYVLGWSIEDAISK